MAESTVSCIWKKTLNLKNRTIYCRDNLDILQEINSNCIDLIYLDPPFNKKKIFAAPIGSRAEGASFKDIFKKEDLKEEWLLTIKEDAETVYSFLGGVRSIEGRTSYNFCYLTYMAIRLIEMERILKDTGSVYLHCDPTMSHYLKLLMDCIFGEKNFRNEISWKRHTSLAKGSQHPPKSWGGSVDILLFYASPKANLRPYRPMTEEEAKKQFPLTDENGERYYNDSAHIWRTPNMGARPNLCFSWSPPPNSWKAKRHTKKLPKFTNPHPSGWRLSKERLDEEYKKGNIVVTKNGKLERRKYERDFRGKQVGNLWDDISPVLGKRRVDYPTQKPISLLERIINASSNEGDVVLDPFCGCATTCVAAEKLKRRWIGIDISVKTYALVKERLKKEVNSAANDQIELLDWDKLVSYSQKSPRRTDP